MTKIEREIKTQPMHNRVVGNCQYNMAVFRLEDTETEKDRDKELEKE